MLIWLKWGNCVYRQMANIWMAGDVEFLEAAHTCPEVFQSGGGSEGAAAKEFYSGFY